MQFITVLCITEIMKLWLRAVTLSEIKEEGDDSFPINH